MQKGDIILVDFPFSNHTNSKLWPALVISGNHLDNYNDLIILGITRSKLGDNNLETPISNKDLSKGFFTNISYIRFSKIVFIEKDKIIKTVGKLKKHKLKEVKSKLIKIF